MAATSFTLFMYLPFELRARVWELAVEPRTVKVGPYQKPPSYDLATGEMGEIPVPSLGAIPVPAIVQVCREARRQGPYQTIFENLNFVSTESAKRRHVWFSPEFDLLEVEHISTCSHMEFAPQVRRLKLVRKFPCAPDFVLLQKCTNLKELHLVPRHSAYDWCEIFARFPPFCGLERIFMVDSRLGTTPLKTGANCSASFTRLINSDAIREIEGDFRRRTQWEIEMEEYEDYARRRWRPKFGPEETFE